MWVQNFIGMTKQTIGNSLVQYGVLIGYILLLYIRIISSIHFFLYVLSFFEFSKGLQVQVYCIIDPHLHWIGSQVKRINQVCAVSEFIESVFLFLFSSFTRIILILFDSKKCMNFVQCFLRCIGIESWYYVKKKDS